MYVISEAYATYEGDQYQQRAVICTDCLKKVVLNAYHVHRTINKFSKYANYFSMTDEKMRFIALSNRQM